MQKNRTFKLHQQFFKLVITLTFPMWVHLAQLSIQSTPLWFLECFTTSYKAILLTKGLGILAPTQVWFERCLSHVNKANSQEFVFYIANSLKWLTQSFTSGEFLDNSSLLRHRRAWRRKEQESLLSSENTALFFSV